MAGRTLTLIALGLTLAGCSPTYVISTIVNCPDGYAYVNRAAASQAEGSATGGSGAGVGSSKVGCSPSGFPPEE